MSKFNLVFALLLCLAPIHNLLAQPASDNPAAEGFNMEASDPEAIAIADAVMESMGGRENWDNTRYLTWGFGNDEQVWDKWTGDFRHQRMEQVVLMNVNSMEGRAWKEGKEVKDEAELKETLAGAYRAWVNSGYWFMMPYKLKDSGVTLKYLGDGETDDGRAAKVLQLTFENVGLTPQNKYHVFVDAETMLVSQWQFFREASNEEPDWSRPWGNWQKYGNIMLSDFRGEGRNGPFVLPHVGAYDNMPEGMFTDPKKVDMEAMGQ